MGRNDYSLKAFLAAARKYGLPTKFLERVQDNYSLKSSGAGGEDLFRPRLSQLLLSSETLNSVQGLSFELPSSEAAGIQAIYHEGTHAFLDLVKEEPTVEALVKAGTKHYTKAPLSDGSLGDDDFRLFQEAMAEYVANRAAAFWRAGEALFLAEKSEKAGHASGQRFWEQFRRIPQKYEQAMGQRVFGYQNKGWPWARSQIETTKSISGKMKDFADRVMLENAIPDQFARVTPFVKSYRSVCRSVPGFYCEF